MNLRNAVTDLMKDLNYGEGYIYAHNTEEKVARMQCMPDSMKDTIYYKPGRAGKEAETAERLEEIRRWKQGEE